MKSKGICHETSLLSRARGRCYRGDVGFRLCRTGGCPTAGCDAPVAAHPGRLHGRRHRRALENIGRCHQPIRRCLRKHLITDYLPGQCCYNLGEYPCRSRGTRTLGRTGTGSAARSWHPAHPGPRGVERFAAAVRRQRAGAAQSGRLSPFRRHGPPPRHAADRVCLERLLRSPRSRFPHEWATRGRLARNLHPVCPLLAGESRLARLLPAAPGADPRRLRRRRHLQRLGLCRSRAHQPGATPAMKC